MAEDRHEDAAGFLRIDENRPDLLAVGKPHVFPGLPAVQRLVDAVAHGEIRPLEALAASDIENLGIRGGDGERANRARLLPVKERRPDAAVIGRLPDASVVDADVEDIRPARHTRRPDRAPAPERPDAAPAHLGEESGIEWLRGCR